MVKPRDLGRIEEALWMRATLLEPCDLLLPMRKGHVRRGADELVGVHQAFPWW